MRCNRCIDYRPQLRDGYNGYTCLACGQAWKWDGSVWCNDGLYDLKSKQKVMEDNMADKRDGFKFVTALSGDEHFVSMINYNGTVYVCTNKSMYKLVDECMVKMEIEMEDNDIELIDDEVSLQINGGMVNHLCGQLVDRIVIVNSKLVNIIMDYDN